MTTRPIAASRSPTAHAAHDGAHGFALHALVFVAISTTALFLLAGLYGVSFAGRDLIDADGYMRVLRVQRLLETGRWLDGLMPRSNYPFGEVLHWTRPMDLVLIALALPLFPFLPRADALYWAAIASGPVLFILCGFALAWARWTIASEDTRRLALITTLTLPAVVALATPGRADHHLLILLAFIATLGCAIRMLGGPRPERAATGAGLALAAGLWLSTEFLLPLALLLSTGVIAWIVTGEPFRRLNLRLAVALATGTAVALLVERGPAGLFASTYDRISAVHLVLALLVLAFWAAVAMLARPPRAATAFQRALVAAALGALALVPLVALFPRVLGGPLVDVDPEVVRVYVDAVPEMQSLWPDDGTPSLLLLLLGWPIVALPMTGYLITQPGDPAQRRAWWLIGAWLIVYLAVALDAVRFTPFPEVLALFVLLEMIGRLLIVVDRVVPERVRMAVRAAVVAAALIALLVGGAALASAAARPIPSGAAAAATAGCPVRLIAPLLERLEGGPQTIVATVAYGPELLFRTRHNVIATPYHRNRAGILDARDILRTPDPRLRRRLIQARAADLVLICPGADAPALDPAPGSLYHALVQGEPPAWLAPVPGAPRGPGRFLLYRIDRARLAASPEA